MSVYDRFNRLLQGRAPLPAATMRRPFQLPNGQVPPMALLPGAKPPQSSLTANQKLSPMMQEILRKAQISRMTPAAGQVNLTTPEAAAGGPAGMTFEQKLMQPRAQGMLNAAAAGFEASGWQDRPVTLGQVLGRMGTAGMKAYTAAEDRIAAQKAAGLDKLLTEAKIKTELGKAGQGFKGTSLAAQDSNNVLNLGPKVANGTASPTQKAAYGMSWQRLSQPRPETRTATDGTVTTVTIPGMDLTGFPVPEGVEAGEKVIGTEAPTFNNDEKLAAAFTNRMIESTSTFENVTAGGYDPSNMRDFAANQLPLAIRGSALSDAGQQYLAAKMNFITAVLRKESGAAISDTEFKNEDLKYFPQPGESAAVIEQKRIARKTAIESMKAQSGGAFSYMQKKMKPSDIDQLPKGSVFMERIGGVSYYKTPEGKVLAVD